jgi:starch synthase
LKPAAYAGQSATLTIVNEHAAKWRLAGRTPRLGVLMVASEVAPWAKTGGLADVLAGLPEALAARGHRVTVVLPRYRGVTIPAGASFARPVQVGLDAHDVTFHVSDVTRSHRVVLVDCPKFFDRDGYYGVGGRDFGDNAQRFGLLAIAALDFAQHDPAAERFDLVHAHDWQAGLVPALIRTQPQRWPRVARSGLVFTIHNLAYQGLFAREVVPALGLDWSVFTLEGGEFWSQFSFLKTGVAYSDFVTTVSPTYALETQQPADGVGMDGVLRARGERYVGILNGIDTTVWNPGVDPLLPAQYGAADPTGKRACKRALLERFGLPVGDDALARPVFGLVSRLVDQKGLDLIVAASGAFVAMDATWIFVGSGEPKYEVFLRQLAAENPGRVGVFIGFDEKLAHLVEAGSDMFLMPSKFEPCGLNQMYSLRYGTVPIVHAVGGLDDTVQSYTARARGANGFKFREPTVDAFLAVVRQAARLFEDREAWARLMRQGMTADHSWEIPAREYVKVYRRARHEAAIRWAE